jgi:hypothetical protein
VISPTSSPLTLGTILQEPTSSAGTTLQEPTSSAPRCNNIDLKNHLTDLINNIPSLETIPPNSDLRTALINHEENMTLFFEEAFLRECNGERVLSVEETLNYEIAVNDIHSQCHTLSHPEEPPTKYQAITRTRRNAISEDKKPSRPGFLEPDRSPSISPPPDRGSYFEEAQSMGFTDSMPPINLSILARTEKQHNNTSRLNRAPIEYMNQLAKLPLPPSMQPLSSQTPFGYVTFPQN